MLREFVLPTNWFKIEEKSLNSITKTRTESRSSLGSIVDELNKILSTDKPSVGFLFLFQTDFWIILPELTALNQVEEIEVTHTKIILSHAGSC
jgi:tRNA nucleotidyltransferase (CCA-adding enzyme)